ncbi:hypothetical protein AN218_23020 [Streptomyces nanshensis]|uniref:Uncharacterized protein n=1 Tax=Streptomyces nanshensis TaxID=518642 RepID=A0A1E7KZD1_9ACTN|nr:hypothetical protein AN218_23020 [Streptomyces nanshensis]
MPESALADLAGPARQLADEAGEFTAGLIRRRPVTEESRALLVLAEDVHKHASRVDELRRAYPDPSGQSDPLAAPSADEVLPVATTRLSRYETCVLEPSDFRYDNYVVYITTRGNGRWLVQHGERSLSADLTWSKGLHPYGRPGWEKAHLFDFETARALAEQAAPHVVAHGVSAAAALAGESWR